MKIVECPRDAIQGWKKQISTSEKIDYLNTLLKIGFDTLDFGSFVSPKAVPQMADTSEVLQNLNLTDTQTKLLAIIANTNGAEMAIQYPEIQYLGFPFSISETFQLKNTNKTILQSLDQVKYIQELCVKHGKEVVMYISMGFGNPYGDKYDKDLVLEWIHTLAKLDLKIFALSDTLGNASEELIDTIFKSVLLEFTNVEFGAHFHALPTENINKISAAYTAGCRRFDSTIHGIGGCPLSGHDLIGNINTNQLINFINTQKIVVNLDHEQLKIANLKAKNIFIL